MRKYPRLTVMLLTYDRWEYARQTLDSVFKHLQYPEPYRLHIADDGSPPEYMAELVDFVQTHGRDASPLISSTNSMQKGYGASYNLATQIIHASADVVLVLEDDWELQRDLDIVRLARAFEIKSVGCVRLGYIGYTQDLRGKFVEVNGDKYLLLDPESPERHVFAGHPRLETVRWQRGVGPWVEGLNAGATEFDTAGKDAARKGVVWPLDLVATRGDMFHHIGARQARQDQREVGWVMQSAERTAAAILVKLQGGTIMPRGGASIERTLDDIFGLIVPVQYGGLSVVDGAVVQTIEGAAEKIVNWAVARPSAGGVVSDVDNDRIVSGSAGDYDVALQVSWVTGLGTTVWTFHIRVDAVESGLSVQRSVAAAGRVGSASAIGVLTLPAGAVLEVYAEHLEGADRELTMVAAQFGIKRVGS